jgi:CheY-specific phosphatase CheX
MEINKLKMLLSEALKQTMTANDHWVNPIRSSIKSALHEVEKREKRKSRHAIQNQSVHDQWWKNIVAGAATSSFAEGQMASESTMKRALLQIDNMLQKEYDTLNSLEAETTKPSQKSTPFGLLND